MRHSMRIMAGGGSLAVMFYFFWTLLNLHMPVMAQDGAEVEVEVLERSWISTWITSGGWGGLLILLVGLLCVVCTLVAATGARGRVRWPHWHGLVLGLGEAAFLMGVFFSFMGMAGGFDVIVALGAAVTPADLAGGFSQALVDVGLGSFVALAALGGAAVIRLRDPVAS